MAMSFLFVFSFVCLTPERVLVGHWPYWPSSAIVLAAVSGWSAAWPLRLMSDILMTAGAYRVGYSGCTSLLERPRPFDTYYIGLEADKWQS